MTRRRPAAGRSRARHTVTASLAALAVTALAACGGLPTSTPVAEGLDVGQPTEVPIHVVPVGPAKDAAGATLIEGFLRASAAAWDDDTVARQFLTATESKATYRPDGSAWIMTPQARPTVKAVAGQGDVYAVTAPVMARLDQDGRYVELPPGSVFKLTLTLARIDGQWRIASGLRGFSQLFSDLDFARFGRYDVVFLSQVAKVPVPDPRYFPVTVGLPTALSHALLAGPPDYLQGAVATGVPEYADLKLPTVTVDDGVAAVTLNRRGGEAAAAQRRQLWDQFVLTLTALPGVNAVQLSAEGARIGVSDLPDRPVTATDLGYGSADYFRPTVVVRTDATTTPVSAADLSGLRITPAVMDVPTIPTRWHRLAVSSDQQDLAATDGANVVMSRWRDGKQLELPPFATELTRPTYDRAGFVWVGGATPAGSRLFVQSTSVASPAAPTALNVPWIAGRRVVSVGIADDGQRALVVSADSAGRTLIQVAGVIRRDGAPVGLADPITLGQRASAVLDATWVDQHTVAVIGTAAGRAHQVVILPIGGPSRVLDAPAGANRITALDGERQLVVVAPGIGAYLRSGNGFERLGSIGEVIVPAR